MSPSTDLVVTTPVRPVNNDPLAIWPEPVDTPGILPRHLIRAASSRIPLLEIAHRLVYRIRPDTHTGLDRVLVAIALYSAAVPVYRYLKDFAIWAFTVQITIPEHDPYVALFLLIAFTDFTSAAKDVLAWMSAEVISKRHSRSAMIVTEGSQQDEMIHPRRLMMSASGRVGSRNMQGVIDNDVSCLPPVGSRIFW